MSIRLKNENNSSQFRDRKTFSPEEIWAAGGTTALGNKVGQSNKKIIDALKSSPEIEPFSEEEWESTLKQLKESK